MVQKKVPLNLFRLGRDLVIINVLRKYKLDTMLLLYQLGTYSPIEHLVNILIMKYGLPPFIATLIITLL